MSQSWVRVRWAAIGAAVAVSLGAGGLGVVQAARGSSERTVFVPINPCRLFDTRPEFQVGDRTMPLGPGEIHTFHGRGAVGQCDLPADATGLVLNVTAVDATEHTFLTFWPAGIDRPNASHLNPAPGGAATPNAVSVDLNEGGEFAVFNRAGSVHVLADVVGYYADHHHDDRYYTKAQTDAALSDVVHADDLEAAIVGAQDVAREVLEDGLVPVSAGMNAGDAPVVLAEVGPLTFTAVCDPWTEPGTDGVQARVSVTSSQAPWYHYFDLKSSADVEDLASTAAGFGAPSYEQAELEAIYVPSAGVSVHAGMITVFLQMGDDDCYFAGHIIPNFR